MTSFDKNIIDKLNAISILDVARRLGIDVRNKHTVCWLHGDKDPSMSFDIRKNRWKCFGCDASGGVIDLVTAKKGLVFPEACQWLCDEFNIIGSSHYKRRRLVRKIIASPTPKNDIQSDTEVYQWIIDNAKISEIAKCYIVDQRHFPEAIIGQYNIRSSSNNDGLLQKCVDKFGQERLLKSGVVKIRKNKYGDNFVGFVWFGDVILFPYYNQDNEIVYIQVRKIDSSSKCKYINLNDVETVPFNMQIISNLSHGDTIVICEGVMDCISLGLLGQNAIGIIGASGFKSKYITMLNDFKIVVIPDNDEAGGKFAKKIETEFLKNGKVIQVLELSKEFKDITEYYESRIK